MIFKGVCWDRPTAAKHECFREFTPDIFQAFSQTLRYFTVQEIEFLKISSGARASAAQQHTIK